MSAGHANRGEAGGAGEAGVRFERAGGVARVTLDRPDRLNAVDSAADAALDRIWDAVERDPDVRCVVLTGTGRAFCAGADMKEDGPGGLAYWARTGRHGFGGIALTGRLSVPIVGRVNGLALGGGFEMALGCDILVAAESATFGLPEPRVGRLPLDAMVTLPRRLPRALAMGLLLTGRRIGSAEALAAGLVNEVVPDADLDGAVDRWVEDILACAPLSLRAIKLSFAGTSHFAEGEARAACLPSLVAALESEDADEGVAAFREKRAPVWKGR